MLRVGLVVPASTPPTSKIGSGGTVLAREPQPRQELNLTPVRRKPSFFDPDCWDGAREKLECRIIPDETSGEPAGEPSQPAQAHRPTKEQAETLVRSLVARLDIPVPTPSVGPDPSVNEWNMAVVGYPLWLWTDTPASMDSTVTGYGVTFTMHARRGATTCGSGNSRRSWFVEQDGLSRGRQTPPSRAGQAPSTPRLVGFAPPRPETLRATLCWCGRQYRCQPGAGRLGSLRGVWSLCPKGRASGQRRPIDGFDGRVQCAIELVVALVSGQALQQGAAKACDQSRVLSQQQVGLVTVVTP